MFIYLHKWNLILPDTLKAGSNFPNLFFNLQYINSCFLKYKFSLELANSPIVSSEQHFCKYRLLPCLEAYHLDYSQNHISFPEFVISLQIRRWTGSLTVSSCGSYNIPRFNEIMFVEFVSNFIKSLVFHIRRCEQISQHCEEVMTYIRNNATFLSFLVLYTSIIVVIKLFHINYNIHLVGIKSFQT